MEGPRLHKQYLVCLMAAFWSPFLTGCQTTVPAPVYCWRPPVIHPAVGKSIAVSNITGPKSIAVPFQQAFLEGMPAEAEGEIRLLSQADLQRYSTIQLASMGGEHQSSDMALLHAARLQKIDFLLSGEILERRGALANQPETLSVSWRLLDVSENRLLGGTPVTVNDEVLKERYSQWASRPDRQQVLFDAAVAESWRLLTPHVTKVTATLARPRFSRGAKSIRAGNAYAESGNWNAAEQIWNEVIQRYPDHHAALHNLALAAAARQDFDAGKTLAQEALRLNDSANYRRTVAWIEGQQMELAKAFDLPAPAAGWLFAPDD
jgi:tetratricopeptide (TPR) repeat protein